MANITNKSGPIGWGIIGCGDVVARKAATGLIANEGQRIVSAMRRNQDALDAFGHRFDVPHTTTDADVLLSRPEVDLVYIATPPDLHLHYASAAAAAGKGVLVEKPAGRCGAETEEIARVCRAASVPAFVSYYRRHLPKAQKIRALLLSGAIGPVVQVDYRMRQPAGPTGWRGDPARSGGGLFYDLAGHVIDLIDSLVGPLEFIGGNALNLRSAGLAEDAANFSFLGHNADGSAVLGQASWNFASIEKADELLIEGHHGRIRSSGMKLGGDVILEVDRRLAKANKGSPITRLRKQLRNRYRPTHRERFSFERPKESHSSLFAAIAETIADDRALRGETIDAAIRTARLMDGALEGYYGGRETGFWDHPERWQGLSTVARSRRRAAATAAANDDAPPTTPPGSLESSEWAVDVDAEARKRFDRDGWAGPFRAEISGLGSTFLPAKERKDLHRTDPQLFRICTHPSIVDRVAALLDMKALSIFKTRLHIKIAETQKNAPKHAIVPWHQDVGKGNGGYNAEGKPIPTYTVWLALDDVTLDSGPLCILPGTHRRLYGDYRENFHANLVERGELSEAEIAGAIPLPMRRGEFCVFHSWLLHGSVSNETKGRRAGLNIRFMRKSDSPDETYDLVDVSPI